MTQKQDQTKINHCWEKIGVWGQEEPRCSVLQEVIHCRNCDVYIQAGRSLLQRSLDDDYRKKCTEVLADKKEFKLSGTVSVVIFKIASEWFALPTTAFAEVIDHGNVHSVPHRNNAVLLGIINVHGEVQLCVSLAALFDLGATQEDNEPQCPRMLIMDMNGEKWVFPVDHIHGIHRVSPQLFQNVPATVSKAKSSHTKALFHWEDNQVCLLDEELLTYSLMRSVQ